MTRDLFARAPKILTGALFSPCRTYRYALWRLWDAPLDSPDLLVVVGLNPSTADETTDDPTIRRCVGFARAWGHTGLVMLNLFALRSTDPQALLSAEEPVGPETDLDLKIQSKGRRVLCAWGSWCEGLRAESGLAFRPVRVAELLAGSARELVCLGRTKNGSPRHPLYVPGAQAPEPFTATQPNEEK